MRPRARPARRCISYTRPATTSCAGAPTPALGAGCGWRPRRCAAACDAEMCGLAGLYDSGHRLDPEKRLRVVQSMAARVAHRGPDDAATWANGAGIAFGFRRLSIIDLSAAGRQPMASADGRYVVAYNGEIYNHRALRKGLAVNWRGHSDTEVLVESIAAHGFGKTLDRLDGMFAIACWDTERRELWLARDPFGEKPLYFGWHNGVFAFASELKAFKGL